MIRIHKSIQNGLLCRVVAATVIACFCSTNFAADRAENYENALARARESKSDLVVFQRGSDWNRLSEALYNEVWMKEDFAKELGPGFVLVAVDRAEVVGGRAVQGQCTAVNCGVTGFSNTQIGNSAPLRLAKFADPKTEFPASELSAVESASGAVYSARPDGAFLARNAPNPAQDKLTLKLKAVRGGKILRLDFPTDPSLPGNGPGRANNGNFALSEVEVLLAGKPVKISSAWASATQGHWGAWQTIDGISNIGDNVWNPQADHHQRRTLLLAMRDAVVGGAEVSVRLHCRSQWGQHVPGCVSAAMLSDAGLDTDVNAVAQAQLLEAKNAKFTWWDKTYCPRIALLDSQGRAVACENKPRSGLTPKTLAELVKKLRQKREQRDALWARAEKAAGPEKAELLRQSLDVLGFGGWAGNENCYKFVHDDMRKADPKDESGAIRWLGFGGGAFGGVAWAPGNEWWKVLEGKKEYPDADYQEALARIDRELKDPRNKILKNEHIQHIMVGKYHVYKRWPGHQEQRFDAQREIAAFDPTTFWGIGAIGYAGMYRQSPIPMLTYGWGPKQLKAGLNTWDMSDTAYFFDHAGTYILTLAHAGGRDGIKFKRVALMDGAAVLSESVPSAEQNEAAPGKKVEVELDLKNWSADRKLVLRVEAEVAEGKTDCTGNFRIEPQLPPPPVKTTAPAALTTLSDAVSDLLVRGDIAALQKKLGDTLMAEAGREVVTPGLRLTLAQHELIRACQAAKVEALARREGGAAFLKSFFGNLEALESFLSSGHADYAQSLENLRLIHVYCTGLDMPLYQRLASALALQWGAGSRYRLVDRFRHIQKAHQEGLLHVGFESHTLREMRWAVYTPGTARDYQFLLDDRQTTVGDYLGACWAIPYVDPNVYGYSVQGWGYADEWTHVYGTGTGNRPFIVQRQMGGVCGTLSGYGAAAAQAHGVMSSTVGQPGHCAYVVRIGERWPVGNDVSGAWSTGFSIYEGTSYAGTTDHLYEKVEADRERFMASARLTWLARLQAERSAPPARILPGMRYSLYRLSNGKLPDFSKLKPEKSGDAPGIDLAALALSNPTNIGIVWEGQIDVAGGVAQKISSHSDDFSRVLIDGECVASANCSRGEKEVPLKPGPHALRVEFSQGGGALHLNVGLEGVRTPGAWTATYEQAIATQPINYNVWLEYIKALEGAKDVPARTWLDLARRACKAFVQYEEASWALTQRCFEKASAAMKPAERMAFLLECHRELRQEKTPGAITYNVPPTLNWQADRIGDPALAVEFLGQLMAIHYSKTPATNAVFGGVLNWGRERFAGNSSTAPAFAKVMETFFKAQGDAFDKNMLANTITGGIRKASEAGDKDSFRVWCDMAEKMLPPLQPGDVHLNAQQVKEAPKAEAFPGVLLSKEGVLQISSVCQFDRPLSYRQILSGGFGGWFDTNNEEKPWAQVQLAGDSELSGIVLLNRYEYAPKEEEFQWAAPLKVSVSADGKKWSDVASFDKAEVVFRVDLQGKGLRARFVRIERLPGDKSKPGRFHFRNFLVYGKKLY